MSSIADLLKEAFEKKDWGIVSLVYQNLTGSALSDNTIFQPRQQTSNVPQRQQKFIPTPDAGKTYARTESVDTSKTKFNIFVDDGTEEVNDKEIDKKLRNKNPIPRNRGNELINIVCTTCGNMYEVNRNYISIPKGRGYTCDKCITKRQ